MQGPYDDMLNLPHHVSSKRTPMSQSARAAQFAPFAALTGYDDAILETGRLTSERIELTEDEKALIDRSLQLLLRDLSSHPKVSVTYFVPDSKKSGGAYVTHTGAALKLDIFRRTLVLKDRSPIPLEDISALTLLPEI